MFVDLLRDVTNIEVRVPQLTLSPADPSAGAAAGDITPSGTVNLFPLQTIFIQITATLTVDVDEVPQNPTMRHLAMECGESDPLTAWARMLSHIHATPVLVTKTVASVTSSNLRTSTTLARLGGGYSDSAFVLEVYPPAVNTSSKPQNTAASPPRRRRSAIGRNFDAGSELESYVSLAWPENPIAESSRPPLRTSFSPPGGALARNPGASFFHACPSIVLKGAGDGSLSQEALRSASPASGAPSSSAAQTLNKQQPQFTYMLPLTVPNVADGSGCIAVRLNLSPSAPPGEAVVTTTAPPSTHSTIVAGADAYEALVDYDTIDAPITHLDTAPSPPTTFSSDGTRSGSSSGGTLGRAASLDSGGAAAGCNTATNNDPLFVGTVVQPIRVRGALECETRSRLVAPNRAHILVSLTNVSSMSTQIHGVEFDLLSTRIGQFKDSLDYAANKSPDYRTAPKALEDNLVAMLARSLAVVPLASDESKPYLQPRETYCFQFVVQLRPHLAHILTSSASSANNSTPSSNINRAIVDSGAKLDVTRSSGFALVDAAGGFTGKTPGQDLQEILKETFVSAVHVQFSADAVVIGGEHLFRSELSVPWTLS
jgi:hypothetical protein